MVDVIGRRWMEGYGWKAVDDRQWVVDVWHRFEMKKDQHVQGGLANKS